MKGLDSITTSLLKDEDKVRLTNKDLFDRVINLQLTSVHKNKYGEAEEETFTIRSDFEVVYPNLSVLNVWKPGTLKNANYYIRKCIQKPSIRVTYTQSTPDVSTAIDIYITNFYMINNKESVLMSFSDDNNQLTKVKIMMGYYPQFEAMARSVVKNKRASKDILSTNTLSISELEADDLQVFKPAYGVDVLEMTVQYVTTDKMPPDSVLHIHGYVGSIYGTRVQDSAKYTFDDLLAAGLIEHTVDDLSYRTDTYLEKLFYKYITKRFIKESITDEMRKSYKDLKYDSNGFMTDESAKKYGIKIICSNGARQLSIKRTSKLAGGDGTKVQRETYFANGFCAMNTFHKINTAVGGNLITRQLVNGNWIVYTDKEAENREKEPLKDQFKLDPIKPTEGSFYYKNTLPAIYNISIGSLTNISAPFFYFINPTGDVNFLSRYRTTSLVDYYVNGEEGTYNVIKQQVEFATVEDKNEMVLVCNNTVSN